MARAAIKSAAPAQAPSANVVLRAALKPQYCVAPELFRKSWTGPASAVGPTVSEGHPDSDGRTAEGFVVPSEQAASASTPMAAAKDRTGEKVRRIDTPVGEKLIRGSPLSGGLSPSNRHLDCKTSSATQAPDGRQISVLQCVYRQPITTWRTIILLRENL